MSDLIERADAIKQIECHQNNEVINRMKTKYALEMVKSSIEELPTAKPKEYVKDGTLTVQMPTIKEAKAIDKIVVYADTYKQEYFMPKVGKWELEFLTSSNGDHYAVYRCNLCKWAEPTLLRRNYCPNCGAKMERSE